MISGWALNANDIALCFDKGSKCEQHALPTTIVTIALCCDKGTPVLYNGLLQIHAWSVMHTWYRCSARTIARDPRFTARRNRVALFSLLWKAAATSPDLCNRRTKRMGRNPLELNNIRNLDNKRQNVCQGSSDETY